MLLMLGLFVFTVAIVWPFGELVITWMERCIVQQQLWRVGLALAIVGMILVMLTGCASPVRPSATTPAATVTFTVRVQHQQTDAPIDGAVVFVDGRAVGQTTAGELIVTVSDQTIAMYVQYAGVIAPIGTVRAHPGNGEVWTFWF